MAGQSTVHNMQCGTRGVLKQVGAAPIIAIEDCRERLGKKLYASIVISSIGDRLDFRRRRAAKQTKAAVRCEGAVSGNRLLTCSA